jgi:hypothetical protein
MTRAESAVKNRSWTWCSTTIVRSHISNPRSIHANLPVHTYRRLHQLRDRQHSRRAGHRFYRKSSYQPLNLQSKGRHSRESQLLRRASLITRPQNLSAWLEKCQQTRNQNSSTVVIRNRNISRTWQAYARSREQARSEEEPIRSNRQPCVFLHQVAYE